MIVQNANPAQMSETAEKKKDAMRAIRTELKYRDLDVQEAASIVEIARRDPEKAIDMLGYLERQRRSSKLPIKSKR